MQHIILYELSGISCNLPVNKLYSTKNQITCCQRFEYYGIEQAEGFLHDFEGWIIFMACMCILTKANIVGNMQVGLNE